MGRVYEAERVDEAWRRDAVATASRRLPAALPSGSRLEHVDCRSSLCQIETSHADEQEAQAYVAAALKTPETQLWNGGFVAVVERDTGGAVRVTAFLAREGREVPLPEELQP